MDWIQRKKTASGIRAGRRGALLCFLICASVISSTWMACHGKTGQEAVIRQSVSGVIVSTVTPSTVDEVYEATGSVRSDRTSIVSSRVMGVVTALHVREGDTVNEGQLLLTLDDRDAKERLKAAVMSMESARQTLSLAEKTRRRYSSLYDQQVISRQEMDQIEAGQKVAQAEYERTKALAGEARTNLAFTRITSPGAGMVTQKHTDVGSMAAPGVPLLVIEGGGDPYVEVDLDEGLIDRIKPGMPVYLTVDSLGKHLEGSIREIVPSVDQGSRTFTIKVGLQDKQLRSGLFSRVRIRIGSKTAILVPEKAIVRKGQLTGVYAVDKEGVITYRLIREGHASDKGTEVLSGLMPNERFITGGIERAVDGGIIRADKGQ